MKKLSILLISLLFIIPFHVKALDPNYTIDSLDIKADIQTNGDVLIEENITQTGSFNGYIRDLYYKGDYTEYDASGIQLIGIWDNSTPFKKVDMGSNGSSHVYEYTENSSYISLKMYNFNPSGSKTYTIKYLLKDVVLVHNDIAELYWTFIGSNFDDDIDNVKITINLPSKSTELRAWAHGPLNGEIELKNKNQVIATIDGLYANNLVDIRMVFDKSIVPTATKTYSDEALNNVIDSETQRADEANQQREQARFIVYGTTGIEALWLIGAIVLLIYVYNKYDKERKSDFNLEYHREFPAFYGPETVEYLMTKGITSKGLSASILNIICKKGFKLKEGEKENAFKVPRKEYTLVNNETNIKEALTPEESFIKNWLLSEYGDGKEVKIEDIKDAAKTESTAQQFLDKYNDWVNKAKVVAVKEDFYDDNTGIKIKTILYAIVGIILGVIVINLSISLMFSVSIIVFAVFMIIYVATFQKRTVKGNDHYVKWMAFKKFLLDFGRFKEKELPEIALWEKYLVYAAAFGISDKVSKAMEIKIKELNLNTNVLPSYYFIYFNHSFTSSLTNSISSAQSLSVSKIAQTSSSSGGGFGGGFSGGGGFGGGGGGGGGRGF